MLNTYLESVLAPPGILSPIRMSETLKVPLSRLARIARLHRNSLSQHPESPAVQDRLGEVARIIATASDLLGGDDTRAVIWFRHQPLSGFEGQTAEELVAGGHIDAVLKHLAILREGGYA
jgi:uncharacterized protein (DUF2384 family)